METDLGETIVRDPFMVWAKTTVREAIALMGDHRPTEGIHGLHAEARCGCVVVVTEERRVVGILTEGDIVRLTAQGIDLDQPVQEVMTRTVIPLRESQLTDLRGTIHLLQQHRIGHLPILDDQDRLVGLVTPSLLLQAQLYTEEHVVNLERLLAERTTSIDTQRQREKLLAELVTQIRSSLNLQTILELTVLGVRQILGCERVNICQFTSDLESMIIAESTDSSRCLLGEQISETICQKTPEEIYHPGQVRVVPDIYTTPMSDCHREMLIRMQTRSKILVPLCCGDRLWGLLNASEGTGPRDWQPQEVELLSSLSVHLAVALQQATTYQQLEESEQRYATLATAVPVGIFRTDFLGNCIYVNELCCQIIGLTRETVLGEGWQQGLHPDDRSMVIEEWHQSLQENRPFQLQYRFQRADGSVTWVYGQSVAEKNSDGQILSYVGTITDVTARVVAEQELHIARRKASEQLLQEGEAPYRALMDNASDAIVLADSQGNLLEVNRQGEKLLGYSREELTRLHISWIHPPEELEAAYQYFQGILLHGGGPPLETLVLHKDGHSIPVEITASRINLNGEQVAQGIFRDVSGIRQREGEIKRLSKRLTLALKSGAIGCWDWDLKENTVFWDERMFELYGATKLSDQSLVYQVWSNALHPEDRQRAEMVGQQAILERKDYDTEFRVIHGDGSIHHIKAYGVLVYDSEGNPQSMIGINFDVSDRKQTENALRESRQFLQTVLDTFPLAVFWKDCQSVMVGCNQFFAQMSNLDSPLEAVGKTNFDFGYSEAEALGYLADDRQVMESGIAKLGIEETLTLSTGEQLWVETNKLPLRDIEGNVMGILGTFQDITHRKKTESQLQEQEQFLRTIYNGVDFPIFVIDVVGSEEFLYIHWNSMAEKASGIASADIIGKTPEQIYGLEAGSEERRRLQECLEIGKSVSHEEELQFPDQGKSWWLTTLNPLKDREGNIYRVVGTTFDITEREQLEQEKSRQVERETLLREITQKIRLSLDIQTIFDTACSEIRTVLQADRVGIFKFYPESGYDDGEFVAESVINGFNSVMAMPVHVHCFGEIHAERYTQGQYQAIDDIYQGGLSPCHIDVLAQFQIQANLVMPLLCGEQLWGLLCIHQCTSVRPWQQSEIALTQQIANQLAIAIQQANLFEQLQKELTERQQAQQEISERNMELSKATRLKDEFLANMSHELRTPLNAILGMTEGLQEQVFGEINQDQDKALQTVESSASHLLELINDILDVAKIESGQIELNCTPTDLDSLCKSSLTFIKQQADKKLIRLEIKNSFNPLPKVLVDKRRIRQVLINLLNNAVKFTPESGKITLEITPSTLASGKDSSQHFLRIAVTDTGIGIAPDHVLRLFQPFIQIDNALNRQYSGTGLGLALVKRIVELHGGQVGLTSELGVGSCFTIDLPYIPCYDSLKDLSGSDLDVMTFPSLASSLILLAEDNEASIATISSYLRAKGYRLIFAKNGQEAVDLAQSANPDLILMDISMPGMDGIEAMGQIRRQRALVDLPIIALTALAMETDRHRCLAAGANDYLSKPVKLKQLTTIIEQHLISRKDTQ